MKPYGLGNKTRFPHKTDCHPPKGWINWWEDIQNIISRKTMKQDIKKELENDLVEVPNPNYLVCPKCGHEFTDEEAREMESYSAYHNRVRYICQFCKHDDDSIAFETHYCWHPYHTIKIKR